MWGSEYIAPIWGVLNAALMKKINIFVKNIFFHNHTRKCRSKSSFWPKFRCCNAKNQAYKHDLTFTNCIRQLGAQLEEIYLQSPLKLQN